MKQEKKTMKYKLGLVISIIILQIIKPLWGQKQLLQILKGIVGLLVNAKGVKCIDANRYITKSSGWEDLEQFLKEKGYETSILFRQCEFWKDGEKHRVLVGKNIGEYFILWEGDSI